MKRSRYYAPVHRAPAALGWLMVFASLLIVLWESQCYGQLTVPDEVNEHEPIVAGCNCIVPENADVRFLWSVDDRSRALEVDGGKQVHIWAGPGEHYVMATVVVQTYTEITVFVPDPEFPNDITKAQLKTIRQAGPIEVQRYEKTYRVLGATPPEPEPDPGPTPPGPEPDPEPIPEGLAGQIRTWLQEIDNRDAYEKAKALEVAANYLSVGSQGADPARNSGFTKLAFVETTKAMNRQTLPVTVRGEWEPLFVGIANWQDKQLRERGVPTGLTAVLSQSQKEAYANIWTQTGEAIQQGAF